MSCGLTSGTTSGTSGSIRKALELSTTTAPRLAAIGLQWRDTAGRRAREHDVDAGERLGRERLDRIGLAPEVERLARAPLGGEELDRATGNPAPRAGGSSAHPRPHWPQQRRRASRSGSLCFSGWSAMELYGPIGPEFASSGRPVETIPARKATGTDSQLSRRPSAGD